MYRAEPKEIEIRPDFQRLFRWSREQQSSFVESLILEIPIPSLFFYETPSGKWELLDGLQRFSTILKFVQSEDVPPDVRGFENNLKDVHTARQHDLNFPLQLTPGEYLTALGGLCFARLPTSLQLNLKRARLQVAVLKRETDARYKYEVFKRLNTGGADLEPQEVRNCSVRLISDEFPDFLQSLAQNADFTAALALDTEYSRNAYVDELALRFLALKNNIAHFQHDLRAFLDSYMKAVASKDLAFSYEAERKAFNRTWALINRVSPEGQVFRGRDAAGRQRGPFSPSLFELVSLTTALHIDTLEPLPNQDVLEKLTTVGAKAREDGLTGAGSNSRKKTLGREILARTPGF